MKIKDVIEGLQIVLKYCGDHDEYRVEAWDEEITAGPTDTAMSDSDVARMVELGWFQNPDSDEPFDEEGYKYNWRWRCYA